MENFALIDVLIIAGLLFFVATRFFSHKLPKTKSKNVKRGRLIDFPQPEAPKQTQAKKAKPAAVKPKTPTQTTGLAAIKELDPTFNRSQFVEGAKHAYGLYHKAYTEGDEETLDNLLSPRLFDEVMTGRDELEKAGHTTLYNVKSVDDVTLVDAHISGQTMIIDVKYTAKTIIAVLDEAGKAVKGKKTVPVDITEIWTWARNASSEDPNWELEHIAKPS